MKLQLLYLTDNGPTRRINYKNDVLQFPPLPLFSIKLNRLNRNSINIKANIKTWFLR